MKRFSYSTLFSSDRPIFIDSGHASAALMTLPKGVTRTSCGIERLRGIQAFPALYSNTGEP